LFAPSLSVTPTKKAILKIKNKGDKKGSPKAAPLLALYLSPLYEETI